MQFIVISHQLKIMLFAAFFGCIFGFLYDIIKIIRMLAKTESAKKFTNRVYEAIFVHTTDVLFMLFLAISFCIFLFYYNCGRFRWYFLFSFIVGFMCYYFSIGKLVCKISSKIVNVIKLIFRILVIKPMLKIGKGIIFILSPFKNYYEYRRSLILTNLEKKRYLKELE